MILTARREDFTSAVQKAVAGLPARPSSPVYAGMLVATPPRGELTFTCSDGDVTFTAEISCDSPHRGSVILPGKLLSEVTRYLSGDTVTLTAEGTTAEISAGKSTFTLSSQDGGRFPSWEHPPGPLIEVDGEEFSSAVRKVSPAASRTEPVLGSVCLSVMEQKLWVVATDSYCLGIASLGASFPRGGSVEMALAPVSVMERFARLAQGTVTLGWDDRRQLVLSAPGVQVTSRQVAGKYFGWERGLEDPGGWVAADTGELTRAVRMAALAADETGGITFTFDGGLIVRARGKAQSAAHVTCDYQGEPMSFLLSAEMLVHGLQGCPDIVEMAFAVKPRPVLVMKGENLRWLVQPRRETG